MLVSQYDTRQMVHSSLYNKEEPYPMTIEEKQKEWRWNRLTKLVLKAIGK
jgi:hypothetical protein